MDLTSPRSPDPGEDEPGPDEVRALQRPWAGVSERRSTYVRLGLAVFAAVAYGIWGAPVPHSPALAWAGIAGAVVYSAILLAWDPYEEYDFLTSAWTITTTDAFLITVFLVATGGWGSPWFPLWYLSVFALALRFGAGETMTAATGYMALYGGIAVWDGALPGALGVFVVRMGFLYAIAALGVLLSQALLEEAVERREYQALARQLRRQVSLLVSVLDATEDGILVTDRDGNIIEWNDRFQEMWNIPDEVLEARDDDRAIRYVLDQLEDPAEFMQGVRDLYERPEATSFDALAFEDGRVFERYSRPQWQGDEVVGRVWSFRDVTDREKALAALEEHAERLQSSNEELEHFAHVVSHDLKTPLQGIRWLVDMVRSDLDEAPEDVEEHLDQLDDRAQRMQAMIDDILELSRVGRSEVPDEDVDPSALVDEVRGTLDAPEGFTIRVQGDLPTVRAPRPPLRQVFQNLVGNALEHHDRDDGVVLVRAEPRDGAVEFVVEDDGPGIPSRFQDKAFALFESPDPAEDSSGTGAGLAIVRRIVEKRGGEVSLDSKEGKGTTVRFTWPDAPSGPDGGGQPEGVP